MVIAGIPCTMPAIWIGLIVIFLIVEGLTAGLVTIWFAVGALAALIAAMFHARCGCSSCGFSPCQSRPSP